MVNNKKRARRRKSRNRRPQSTLSKENLSATKAMATFGRTTLPGSIQDNDILVIEIKLMQVITSSGAGLINTVIQANPGGYTDWGSVAALWKEYRVLSTIFIYEPIYNNTYAAALAQNILITCFDRVDTTALASYSLAWNCASSVIGNTGKKSVRTMKLIGIEDAGFVATGTPTTVWSYKMYADTLTFTTTYGRVFIRALIQFRGRY